MKRILLTAAFLAGSFAAAQAADLPAQKTSPAYPAPIFTWTGLYAGLNGGVAIGGGEFADPVPMNGVAPLFGGTIGYNWQYSPNVVLGLEADLDYRGSIAASASSYQSISSASSGILGTVRPRIGFALDRALLYVTGGLAFGNVTSPSSFAGAGVVGPAFIAGWRNGSASFQPGWTVGGGVEYALNGNWSLKAEYLYVKLQHTNPVYATTYAALPQWPICNTNGLHVMRVGLNYRFGSSAAPVVAKY